MEHPRRLVHTHFRKPASVLLENIRVIHCETIRSSWWSISKKRIFITELWRCLLCTSAEQPAKMCQARFSVPYRIICTSHHSLYQLLSSCCSIHKLEAVVRTSRRFLWSLVLDMSSIYLTIWSSPWLCTGSLYLEAANFACHFWLTISPLSWFCWASFTFFVIFASGTFSPSSLRHTGLG